MVIYFEQKLHTAKILNSTGVRDIILLQGKSTTKSVAYAVDNRTKALQE